ncbi:hypothetical protein [Streptomyces cadmiisoli]|uniref:hypothetical protein n=1 Tax=Streptomyces cadmiisoli TaxID=2184053 RepID=UPI00364DBF5A
MPYDRRVIDFRPAPAGWQLVYLADDEPEGYVTMPMPGWLVLEEVFFNNKGGIDAEHTPAPGDRWRTILAASADGSTLHPAEDDENFWMAIGPGEAEPPDQLVEEEKAQRREAAS